MAITINDLTYWYVETIMCYEIVYKVYKNDFDDVIYIAEQ